MNTIVHYLQKNGCYKKAAKMTPGGIIVHSTAAINKSVTRYVDASELGKVSSMHWNTNTISKCVHDMIGWSDILQTVVCVQTLPYNYKPWGCGSGTKGSYNQSHIQFEICEGADSDKDYFKSAYDTAVQLCAELCKKYNLKASDICDHREAHARGYASNHADVSGKTAYFTRHGKTMDNFRSDVDKLLKGQNTTPSVPSVPIKVKVASATIYKDSKGTKTTKTCTGIFTITEVKGDYGRLKSGAGWLYLRNITIVK